MQILQNLVQMTCLRDHLRLELSVLSTLLQLPHITGIRALELGHWGQQYWVRPRTWSEQRQLLTGEPDFHSDPQRQPLSHYPQLQQCIAQHALQAEHINTQGEHVLLLPVWMHEKAQVCIEITQSEAFSPAGMDIITGVFNVYKNYQSLLDYSERDALTDLLNRKTFDEHLLHFASQGLSARRQAHAWLAVIDIDHFKQVNDRFGHLFGDEVLILVANLLRTAFGQQHRIFRFGGEEFVVLMPASDLPCAQQALENFRYMVASHTFPQIGQVTVSVGFAGAKMASPVEVLGQADQALYFAKAHGRNRVCHYETLQANGELGNGHVAHADVELF